MKLNQDIQAALISYLKGQATVLALLTDVHEIREDQWAGRNFVYPAIRVALRSNYPSMDNDCPSRVGGSIFVYSETASSKQADTIAGEVAVVCHQKSFTRNNCRFSLVVTGIVPAIAESVETWRSEVLFRAIVS